jgi:hypothetical protein
VGRHRDALDFRLTTWARGADPEIDLAIGVMPGELADVLRIAYGTERRRLKVALLDYPGSTATFWQRWKAGRAWLGGWLAASRPTSGE